MTAYRGVKYHLLLIKNRFCNWYLIAYYFNNAFTVIGRNTNIYIWFLINVLKKPLSLYGKSKFYSKINPNAKEQYNFGCMTLMNAHV